MAQQGQRKAWHKSGSACREEIKALHLEIHCCRAASFKALARQSGIGYSTSFFSERSYIPNEAIGMAFLEKDRSNSRNLHGSWGLINFQVERIRLWLVVWSYFLYPFAAVPGKKRVRNFSPRLDVQPRSPLVQPTAIVELYLAAVQPKGANNQLQNPKETYLFCQIQIFQDAMRCGAMRCDARPCNARPCNNYICMGNVSQPVPDTLCFAW